MMSTQSNKYLKKLAFLLAALLLLQVICFSCLWSFSLLNSERYKFFGFFKKTGPSSATGLANYLRKNPNLTQLEKFDALLRHIPGYRTEINCTNARAGNKEAIAKAENWRINSEGWIKDVMTFQDKCAKIRAMFAFPDKPMSQEEADYPLAYGVLVYKEPLQVYFMLSVFYQPQNQYCVAVDDGSSSEFKDQMDLLDECFPNIQVKYVNKVKWCDFSVLRAVYRCVKHLTNLKSDWRYYQVGLHSQPQNAESFF
ncbi:hypothetical protein L596_021129 [Steinernema carpocapsae]|uniref:Hexosyltransferase n=1 Tax=Steinernema carpocapsae TaxID=34508 RepID=A0A4U5MVI8_STECR|nr:hypothetical protein L596_021129 [Steinernema carpocapsae]